MEKKTKQKRHNARFKPKHSNYQVKLLGLNTINNGRDCKTGYRKQDLTISHLKKYFKYKYANG